MGINSGILTNASPLSRDQIAQLEEQVLANNETYAYLNEDGQICFSMPTGIEELDDFAVHTANELSDINDVRTRKIYKKTGLKTFVMDKCEIETENYTTTENEFGGITYTIGGTK